MSDRSDGLAVKRPRLDESIGALGVAKRTARRSATDGRCVNTGPESQKLSDMELKAKWAAYNRRLQRINAVVLAWRWLSLPVISGLACRWLSSANFGLAGLVEARRSQAMR